MVLFEFLNGPEAGRKVELGPGRHVLGRAPAADLLVKMSAVSGRHLEVEIGADGAVRFKDLGSTNGTWSGGIKVTEGEWFPGSQLKLGNALLRLVDAAAAAAPDAAGAAAGPGAAAEEGEDDALHRRAVERAMSGRGGGLKLLLLLAVVAGGAGAWWYFSQGQEGGGRERSPGAGKTAAAARSADLIEGHGAFEEARADAWNLDAGMSIHDGVLTSEGGRRRALLTTRFPFDGGALEISVRTGSLGVWPELSWGTGEDETVSGPWVGGRLGQAPVILPLPEEAEWFRLAILTEGGGNLEQLELRAAEGSAELRTHESRRYLLEGANLILLHRDGRPLLQAHGVDGAWQPVPGGFDLASRGGESWVELAAGPATAESGPTLIFSETGPVIAAPGVVVENAPGMLLGGEARRLWVRFDGSRKAAASESGVLVQPGGPLQLRWDLDEALVESKRLAREMERAARDENTATLLASSASLLRDWPFDEDDVDRAILLRRNAIVGGRKAFGLLEIAAAEALFFESAEDVAAVEARARELAASLPGTDVARDADNLAGILKGAGDRLVSEARARSAAYRRRLLDALAGPYPFLTTWLRREEGAEQ